MHTGLPASQPLLPVQRATLSSVVHRVSPSIGNPFGVDHAFISVNAPPALESMGNKQSPASTKSKDLVSKDIVKFYTIDLHKTRWHFPEWYVDPQPVGLGAFGQVCSALDLKTNSRVAIKKLVRPFRSSMHACRAYREITILKSLDHENVIKLLGVYTPAKDCAHLEEIYLISQLMRGDLSTIITTQTLCPAQIQLITYQILRGLKYVHSAGLTHRDLKPTNITINENIEVKIIDFGLAREVDTEMTGYVETRWYRAPEVMLQWKHYDQAVDLWSVGCIMAEMMTSRTLLPGKTALDQLDLIFELVGTPDAEYISHITSKDSRTYLASRPQLAPQPLSTIFGSSATAETLSLIGGLLQLNPEKRLSASAALAHSYFGGLHDECDEPTAPETYVAYCQRRSLPLPADNARLTIGDLKCLLFNEVEMLGSGK